MLQADCWETAREWKHSACYLQTMQRSAQLRIAVLLRFRVGFSGFHLPSSLPCCFRHKLHFASSSNHFSLNLNRLIRDTLHPLTTRQRTMKIHSHTSTKYFPIRFIYTICTCNTYNKCAVKCKTIYDLNFPGFILRHLINFNELWEHWWKIYAHFKNGASNRFQKIQKRHQVYHYFTFISKDGVGVTTLWMTAQANRATIKE